MVRGHDHKLISSTTQGHFNPITPLATLTLTLLNTAVQFA